MDFVARIGGKEDFNIVELRGTTRAILTRRRAADHGQRRPEPSWREADRERSGDSSLLRNVAH
jgi:hypothetical protein